MKEQQLPTLALKIPAHRTEQIIDILTAEIERKRQYQETEIANMSWITYLSHATMKKAKRWWGGYSDFSIADSRDLATQQLAVLQRAGASSDKMYVNDLYAGAELYGFKNSKNPNECFSYTFFSHLKVSLLENAITQIATLNENPLTKAAMLNKAITAKNFSPALIKRLSHCKFKRQLEDELSKNWYTLMPILYANSGIKKLFDVFNNNQFQGLFLTPNKSIKESVSNPTPFHRDIWSIIADYLTIDDVLNLRQSCRFTYHVLENKVSTRMLHRGKVININPRLSTEIGDYFYTGSDHIAISQQNSFGSLQICIIHKQKADRLYTHRLSDTFVDVGSTPLISSDVFEFKVNHLTVITSCFAMHDADNQSRYVVDVTHDQDNGPSLSYQHQFVVPTNPDDSTIQFKIIQPKVNVTDVEMTSNSYNRYRVRFFQNSDNDANEIITATVISLP